MQSKTPLLNTVLLAGAGLALATVVLGESPKSQERRVVQRLKKEGYMIGTIYKNTDTSVMKYWCIAYPGTTGIGHTLGDFHKTERGLTFRTRLDSYWADNCDESYVTSRYPNESVKVEIDQNVADREEPAKLYEILRDEGVTIEETEAINHVKDFLKKRPWRK